MSYKDRYAVLQGDVKICCRTILVQISEYEWFLILKGAVSKDHVHAHIKYRPSQDIGTLVKLMKGRSLRKF